ncbi:hypothetical protein [Chitinophaga sp. Ak27]|uniref:hypothetical protein n=1 Tax=Chitinophaga sp. Ak27 TaxID=2726116 RepID=UPI00145F7CA5|nr:hypothetical protein [Chitinophaga sp. Ak27]NLU93227.1 hypothetical protein [Chitinophaga sp. Ak27]
MERRSIQTPQPDGEAGRFISAYRLRSSRYNLSELVATPPVQSSQTGSRTTRFIFRPICISH